MTNIVRVGMTMNDDVSMNNASVQPELRADVLFTLAHTAL